MSRCRCCNNEMSLRDFRMKRVDGKEEDLCSTCLGFVYSPNFCDSRTYQFESLCDEFYIPEKYEE